MSPVRAVRDFATGRTKARAWGTRCNPGTGRNGYVGDEQRRVGHRGRGRRRSPCSERSMEDGLLAPAPGNTGGAFVTFILAAPITADLLAPETALTLAHLVKCAGKRRLAHRPFGVQPKHEIAPEAVRERPTARIGTTLPFPDVVLVLGHEVLAHRPVLRPGPAQGVLAFSVEGAGWRA